MANTAVLKLQVIADASKAVGAMRDMTGAADSASAKTETAGSRLKSFGKAAAYAAGAAALGGLVYMFKTGVGEQKDFLAGQAQLAAGIKSTGNAANVSVKGMEGLASTIQDYSGQTDDSIVASEKLMLTFTNVRNSAGKNNDVFDQSIKVTADMAARMGGDASKYAVQLGKALNDPVKGLTALTRIGVTFTDQQQKQVKAMVANGDAMGAQKLIIKELNKEFGGSAKAFGDTLPGQMERAKRSFEDISQQLVASLMPILTTLAQVILRDVLPAVKKVIDFISANIKWLLPLAAGITAVVLAYKAWKFATELLTEANRKLIISFATNPFVLIIAGIIALVLAFKYAYDHFTWFRNAVKAVLRVVANTFQWLWGVVKAVFRALSSAIRGVASVFKTVWDHIGGIVKTATKVVSTAVRIMIAVVKGYLKVLYTVYVLPWILAFRALKTVVTQWAPAVLGWMKNIVAKVASGLSTVANIIKAPFVSAWNWIKSNIVNPMERMFSGLAGAIRSALSGVTNAITAPFKAAWEFIKKYVLRPVSSAWNSVANLINSVSIDIPKIHIPLDGDIGGGSIGFPNVPTMPSWATGAYVTAPTAALIGEAGGEWVLPDAKLRALLRQELGAGGPTIVVQGALDPDAVARQIERILRKRAQRVGGVAARGQVGAFQ